MITKEQYKVLKQLCNQYEKEQRQKKSNNLDKYLDIYYNGYYLYALDKTENRPDEYLSELIKQYGHLDIILDLTVCNGFGNFTGKEVYSIKNKKLTYIKEKDLSVVSYLFIQEKRGF